MLLSYTLSCTYYYYFFLAASFFFFLASASSFAIFSAATLSACALSALTSAALLFSASSSFHLFINEKMCKQIIAYRLAFPPFLASHTGPFLDLPWLHIAFAVVVFSLLPAIVDIPHSLLFFQQPV